jgi:DNA-binding response OmpR family regulator
MKALLLHDEFSDVAPVRDALAQDGILLDVSTSFLFTDELRDHPPAVILIQVRTMADARIELGRRWRAENHFTGTLVLLCPASLATDAFRLCREGTFDDYVLIDSGDEYRLRHVVVRAHTLRRFESSRVALAEVRQSLRTARLSTASALRASAHGRTSAIAEVRTLANAQVEALGHVDQTLECASARVRSLRRRHSQLLLLVDDDPWFRDLFRDMTRDLGYRLVTTGSPGDTLDLIDDLDPACVILDVEMPDTSGIDVLQAIRTKSPLSDVPVLLLTGRSDLETVRAAKSLHVSGYLVKPPHIEDLAAKLSMIMRID